MFERRILRGLMLAVALALVVALLPSMALANKGNPGSGAVGHKTISGSPLTIHVATDTSIQVDYAGKLDGQVWPPDRDEADSGGFAWFDVPNARVAQPAQVWGPDWANHDVSDGNIVNPWAFNSQSPILGTGTAADPWKVSTSVQGPGVEVRQWVRYADGDNCFRVLYNIINEESPNPDPFTFFHAADLWPDDSDNGYGFYDTATGAVGGWNQARTFLEYFVPVLVDFGFAMPAPSHYQEADYKEIWNRIGTGPLSKGLGFNDSIRTDWHDSGAGLQWDLNFPGVPPSEPPYPGNFIEIVFDWCFFQEEAPEFVPEPGSVMLLASGLMGLAGYAGLRKWRG